jgi:hypothetical protein
VAADNLFGPDQLIVRLKNFARRRDDDPECNDTLASLNPKLAEALAALLSQLRISGQQCPI